MNAKKNLTSIYLSLSFIALMYVWLWYGISLFVNRFERGEALDWIVWIMECHLELFVPLAVLLLVWIVNVIITFIVVSLWDARKSALNKARLIYNRIKKAIRFDRFEKGSGE